MSSGCLNRSPIDMGNISLCRLPCCSKWHTIVYLWGARVCASAQPHRNRPTTFAEVRRNAEERLALGLKLDFDQIMLDIEAIRKQAEKPSKN